MKWTGAEVESVLVRVLQRNRTNKIYVDIRKRRFTIGIVSHDYGGQEAPQSAECQVKAQEA